MKVSIYAVPIVDGWDGGFKKGFPHILYIYVHHQAVQKYSLARLFVSREILYICIELLTYTFHLLFLKFLYVGKPCKRFARLFLCFT